MTQTEPEQKQPAEATYASGVLEITEKGYGFLRQQQNDFKATPGDVFISKDFIGGDRLRTGLFIEGEVVAANKKKWGWDG